MPASHRMDRVPETPAATAAPANAEVATLRSLSPQQWKSGIAAWLGWLFDGLDMHLYTLVATAFVAILINGQSFRTEFTQLDTNHDGRISSAEWQRGGKFRADGNGGSVARDEFEVFLARSQTGGAEVKQKSSWIQAAFLIGWALGGGFFGRVGDLLGRSRALSLTVLTYATFTGLSFFAQTWWHLLIFRFLAALGIGGEWAVGSTLLAETWPKKWRPWTAAALQTGVNIGVLGACLAGVMLGGLHPRWIFLIGVVPAVLVFWIRRNVPEPEAWHAAKATTKQPAVSDLFGPDVRRTTLLCLGCAPARSHGWWAFMFWQAQHVRGCRWLPWVVQSRDKLVAKTFALIIGVSIVGNFVAGALVRRMSWRGAIISMFAGFVVTMALAFGPEHSLAALTRFWLPAVGFWSGVFGLFTMFIPPLFPTLLRTTGAGFCYNIGRIIAAFGTVFFGLVSSVGNYRAALFYAGFLYVPAAVVAFFLPRGKD
jgi:MFS family permease